MEKKYSTMLCSAVALCAVNSALASEKAAVVDLGEGEARPFGTVDEYKGLVQTLNVPIGSGPDCESGPAVYGPIQYRAFFISRRLAQNERGASESTSGFFGTGLEAVRRQHRAPRDP
jgi:hypothetical protein